MQMCYLRLHRLLGSRCCSMRERDPKKYDGVSFAYKVNKAADTEQKRKEANQHPYGKRKTHDEPVKHDVYKEL